MYLDVKRLVSTGVGNLLDQDDPERFGSNPQPLPEIFTLGWSDKNTGVPANRDEILQEYRTVKFSNTANLPTPQRERITRLVITEDAVDALVARKRDSFEAALKQRQPFAAFESWPADAQLGVMSMAWAMGPKFRFPRFQAAAQAADWLEAAKAGRVAPPPRGLRWGGGS
jgi:hypothetical protein